VPGFAVSVWPACAVPLIVGGEVFDGGVGFAATTPVAAEAAEAEPALFDAVTTVRSVEPTSVLVTAYVLPVAPAMSAQLLPVLSQRRH